MTTGPKRVQRRIVVHFPGFEPLDARAHHRRYVRSSEQSSAAFGFSVMTHGLDGNIMAPSFEVSAEGPNWSTKTSIFLLGHQSIIARLKAVPFHIRLLRGYSAALATLWEGAFLRYIIVAWRFALFFLFPFIAMAIGLLCAILVASLPVIFEIHGLHYLWSIPFSAVLFAFLFLPWAERAHIQHLFAHWQLAVKLSRLDDDEVKSLIEDHVAILVDALGRNADEYLISSHSLGGTFAIHALGALIERHPESLQGKSIALVTLAGPGLQSSLMKSAVVLRHRVKTVLTHAGVLWVDFQCLSDLVNFYRGRVARDNGFNEIEEPAIRLIRIKQMVSRERYRRMRWDGLRLHRQFVLGSDKPSCYDFTLLTAGPFSAKEFATFNFYSLPPLDRNGAITVLSAGVQTPSGNLATNVQN